MADLHQNLAQIRELQGREPLPSPHVIQGFEPGSAPVPPFLTREVDSPSGQVTDFDEFELDAGPPQEPVPPSPLVPRRPPSLVQPPGDPLDAIVAGVAERLLGGALGTQGVPQCAVMDNRATWKGREVALSEADSRAIRAVVLKAIQREVLADLQAAGVRRVRRAKAVADPVTGEPVKPARRRGRPRGSLLQ